MGRKSRGINAERDLIHKFWSLKWAAMRSAGSGSMQYPSPDVIASNNVRKLAIECKLTSDTKKYIPEAEIEQLRIFCEMFGAEMWIAVKFPGLEWAFFMVEDLVRTEASYMADIPLAKRKGLTLEQVTEQ